MGRRRNRAKSNNNISMKVVRTKILIIYFNEELAGFVQNLPAPVHAAAFRQSSSIAATAIYSTPRTVKRPRDTPS